MISFEPLFDYLHYNKLQIKDLQENLGFSPRTTAKFRRGDSVSLITVEKICSYYKIPIEQVVKITFDSE